MNFKAAQMHRKTMTDNGYRRISNLFVNRRRVREKKQIRVQIGNHQYIGMVLQDEKGERGGAGKVVLQQPPIPLCLQKLRIRTFQILNGKQRELRQGKMRKDGVDQGIHAQDP